MGEYSHFRIGQKAPNNGVYIEIGETGSSVNEPKMVKLKAGEKFPQTSNHNRVWTYDKN
ncbi:YjzC family protein [Virgibacillus salexigens]|uniref:YjzC family protein n=1 Tax=Virgibacillus salexigens TaxID=61016 RepID=UPI00190DB09D|nr:YjzC family protein [Virgibacillus salexigens]